MSISTGGGGERRPSTVSTGKKAPAGGKPAGSKPASAKPAGGKTGGRPAGKGRKVTPVRVSQGRSWGPILLFGAVILLAVAIVGYGAFAVSRGAQTWEDRAADIEGIVNYRESQPDLVKGSQHREGPIQYPIRPPVAGEHNPRIQQCMGEIYAEPIASEHAVHSLEHGAVWVTYKRGLAADQVEKLAAKVRGQEKMLMSPFEGLDANVSLQAWGYQLKVESVDDGRIDEFIRSLRVNASVEGPTAPCDGGVTATGTAPQSGQAPPPGS